MLKFDGNPMQNHVLALVFLGGVKIECTPWKFTGKLFIRKLPLTIFLKIALPQVID